MGNGSVVSQRQTLAVTVASERSCMISFDSARRDSTTPMSEPIIVVVSHSVFPLVFSIGTRWWSLNGVLDAPDKARRPADIKQRLTRFRQRSIASTPDLTMIQSPCVVTVTRLAWPLPRSLVSMNVLECASTMGPSRIAGVRCRGVFGAVAGKARTAAACAARAVLWPEARAGARHTEDAEGALPKHVAMSWMRRLKRVSAVEIERCRRCGGRIEVIASIEDPVRRGPRSIH